MLITLTTLFTVPFLQVLGAAGCPNWMQLFEHLSAIAWKHLAMEQLQPHSSKFWEGELTRLYCEYVQKGKEFEEGVCDYHLIPS